MNLAAFFTKRSSKYLLTVLLVLCLLANSACQSTQFLWQAARGQWQIVASGTPIKEVISDTSTPAKTASQLKFVETVRDYAEQRLLLPVSGAYTDYADLHRPYVVWNLFVAPQLDLTSKTWCYPIAGCVAYQGYFSEQAALQAANHWQQRGFDTYVGGVAAYSTLGWFDDPVLNTFLFYDQIPLAALLFHELAHRQLYIAGDTTFNESWATALEQEAIEQFMVDLTTADKSASPLQQGLNPAQISAYRSRFADRHAFVQLVQATVEKLASVYASEKKEAQKKAQKKALINQLKRQYQQAVAQKSVSGRYKRWFAGAINNAKLSTVSSYHQWVPGLRFKIRALGHDWLAFHQWSAELSELDQRARNALLERLNLEADQENITPSETIASAAVEDEQQTPYIQ